MPSPRVSPTADPGRAPRAAPDLPENASESARRLLERLARRDSLIGVIGLGYVGLPLALAFADAGLSVLGFDVDDKKVEGLLAGKSYIDHIAPNRVASARDKKRLDVTVDFARLGEPDVLLICVPTPITVHRDPDLRFVLQTARAIADQLREGQLVILESTTWPGTTEEILLPMFEERGFEVGRDVFLAFSPEREDPGNAHHDTTTIPKVIGGVDPCSGALAEAVYTHIVPVTVSVSSARAAEATKLTENVFRAVNIALVNELKVIYDALDIDVREVLDAAATKPFGFMRFDPGPGWGGHCIPVDPFYLSWKAREVGQTARFVELAGVINVEMPRWVLSRLQDALNDRGKAMKGSHIMILGLAYKNDVADPRESPAFEVMDLLLHRGARVSYHDPHVPISPAMRSWPDLPTLRSEELTAETLASKDAVVIVTAHSSVDYDLVQRHSKLVVDSRGVYREPLANVVRA